VLAWLLVTGIGLAGDPLFEVARADGIDVVRVRNRRSSRVTFMGPVQRIARPRGLSLQRSIVLGHAGPGEVAPILAWFPIDELIGYQFTYPASSPNAGRAATPR